MSSIHNNQSSPQSPIDHTNQDQPLSNSNANSNQDARIRLAASQAGPISLTSYLSLVRPSVRRALFPDSTNHRLTSPASTPSIRQEQNPPSESFNPSSSTNHSPSLTISIPSIRQVQILSSESSNPPTPVTSRLNDNHSNTNSPIPWSNLIDLADRQLRVSNVLTFIRSDGSENRMPLYVSSEGNVDNSEPDSPAPPAIRRVSHLMELLNNNSPAIPRRNQP